MITEKKLKIYEKYNGFVEAYIIKNSDLPNNDFDENDWLVINELISSIVMIKKDSVSHDYKLKLQEYINSQVANITVIRYLESMADSKMEK